MTQEKVILVVDDEAEIRSILVEFITRKGCRVLQAESGKKALALLEGTHVDVVISDLRMPDGDGLAVIEGIAKLPQPRPHAVLLSAYADLPPEQLRMLSSVPVLSKPFQLAQVWRTINAWIRVDAS